MKLLRYGTPGNEKPGLLAPSGEIRDLSTIVNDITGATLNPTTIDKLRSVNPDSLPLVEGTPRLGPPVKTPAKYLAIGLNYADHAAETGMPVPEEPLVFTKATSCISGPNDPIIIPPDAQKCDHEVELAFIIGTRAHRVSVDNAMSYVAGYCIANDVSERAWQKETSGQWIKGKSLDSFGPLGPWLVTKDEIHDPHKLSLFLEVNGERRQDSNTNQLIFSVSQILSTVSRYMTLEAGDVIATGTPSGVGWGKTPPVFLKPGDQLRLGIEGLGEQHQTVIEHAPEK